MAVRMRKALRRFKSLSAMKSESYRYWRSRPGSERLAAVSELTSAAYGLKGLAPHVSGLQRTLVRVQRARS